MADEVKKMIMKFFVKKKEDPSNNLDNSTNNPSQPSQSSEPSTSAGAKAALSAAKQAAAAALARNEASKTKFGAAQAQVLRERRAAAAMEEARQSQATTKPPPAQEPDELSPLLAVQGVYFKCPLIGPAILSKEKWQVKIKEFLYEHMEGEEGRAACLIIRSCNNNKDKVDECVETLCKYLENIVNKPSEEKYRKIRMSNRIFQEKVSGQEGVIAFLEAAGFSQQMLPFQDSEEPFLVVSETALEDLENIQLLIDALRTAEPIGLDLDRNMQVLLPSQAAQKTELPPEFFRLTPEEFKRQQQLRTERLVNLLTLKTKATREKEEKYLNKEMKTEMKKYKFALIRIRFPDGVLLQGTFGVYEKLEEVLAFVREHIISEDAEFVLRTATGRLTEADFSKTLIELHLVPATTLLFIWTGEGCTEETYLKPEVLAQMQSL